MLETRAHQRRVRTLIAMTATVEVFLLRSWSFPTKPSQLGPVGGESAPILCARLAVGAGGVTCALRSGFRDVSTRIRSSLGVVMWGSCPLAPGPPFARVLGR